MSQGSSPDPNAAAPSIPSDYNKSNTGRPAENCRTWLSIVIICNPGYLFPPRAPRCEITRPPPLQPSQSRILILPIKIQLHLRSIIVQLSNFKQSRLGDARGLGRSSGFPAVEPLHSAQLGVREFESADAGRSCNVKERPSPRIRDYVVAPTGREMVEGFFAGNADLRAVRIRV